MAFTFLNRLRRADTPATMPRLYAIGDIHGRADLFEQIIDHIKDDVLTRDQRPTRIIILGDFIDRGPASAAIVTLLMRLRKESNLIVLKGNHEAAMVDALAGDHDALDLWLAHGGLETLASFGVDVDDIDQADTLQILRRARAEIPPSIRRWLRDLPTHASFGRYYFVHAGIQPGVPLDEQSDASRLWITDDFIASDADHGAVIVHGHTIHEDGVQIMPNRIGVDTGAYRTGKLSAVMIEDDRIEVITSNG
ncbi:metallophosphoesterase family protein [uncultured Sphingomonas sp.]|uniref:metallophosphoesterase family protein n=1 Tax=uncultured Sphingomonas sp. TaxID=158754 RepID=UPI0035CC8CF2